MSHPVVCTFTRPYIVVPGWDSFKLLSLVNVIQPPNGHMEFIHLYAYENKGFYEALVNWSRFLVRSAYLLTDLLRFHK